MLNERDTLHTLYCVNNYLCNIITLFPKVSIWLAHILVWRVRPFSLPLLVKEKGLACQANTPTPICIEISNLNHSRTDDGSVNNCSLA